MQTFSLGNIKKHTHNSISWVIPPDVLHYLSTTDFPNDFDLYDFMNPYVKEIFINSNAILQPVKKIRGNLCLSSCPGKKVRLSGPVRGRATIDRDLDLDFERMRMFGITTLVWYEKKYVISEKN